MEQFIGCDAHKEFSVYGQRQAIAEDQTCGSKVGGDPDACPPIFKRLDELFSDGTSESLEAACRALPVDFFVAKDTDAVWRNPISWVWQRRTIFQNEFVRLIPCH